jgi:hypothetical protein
MDRGRFVGVAQQDIRWREHRAQDRSPLKPQRRKSQIGGVLWKQAVDRNSFYVSLAPLDERDSDDTSIMNVTQERRSFQVYRH